MDEEESLRTFGLHPAAGDLDRVRALLRTHLELGWDEQDLDLMKLCCMQLFNAGELSDVPLIWLAKVSGFDAHCSIDVQLLCGAGLDATKAYLGADGSADAAAALTYLLECEATGDFEAFSVTGRSQMYSSYYSS